MEEWMMEEGKCDGSAWKVESWSARVNRVRPSNRGEDAPATVKDGGSK